MGSRRLKATQSEISTGAPRLPFTLALGAALLASLLTPRPTLAIGVDQKVSSICKNSKDAAFREKYCGAAKDYKQGYTTNRATSAVWAGVTITCAAVCGKAVGPLVCKGASVAGTAGEGALTKKFTESLTGEVTGTGKELLAKASATTPTTAATSEGAEDSQTTSQLGGGNNDACVTAGTSALKAYSKNSEANRNDKSLTELKKNSDNITPTIGGVAFQTQSTEVPNAGNETNIHAATAVSNSCTDDATKTALGAIRCATANDPTLPGFVQSEGFLKDLQKASGKTADAFFGGFESPSKSIFESPSISSLPASQQNALAETAGIMEKYSEMKAGAPLKDRLASTSSDEPYRPAGSSVPQAAIESEFDLNGAIANVLGQLGADGRPVAANGSKITATVKQREPSSVVSPEDRTISIFDRVKWRYSAISARDFSTTHGVK